MSTSIRTSATSTETTREVAQYHTNTHKIDRLSLLPNELLDHIFDLAYSLDTPSTGTLSKYLLPFHISGIYRRISLTKAENIAKLFQKINKSPDLAKIVKMLHLDCEEDPFGVFNRLSTTEIEQFFRQFVRLEWLDLGKDSYEWLDRLIPNRNSTSSSPLGHVTSGASPHSRQPLVDFTSFPTLRSLHVVTYDHDYEAFDTNGLSCLNLLTHLTISGLYADNLSIASFCTLCPSLIQLTLHCVCPDYPPLLESLTTSLVNLELCSTNDHQGILCGRELSRFTQLQHLAISSFLFSYDLPSHLDGLVALESLELGQGHVSTDGLIGLIAKLPSLRQLKLDLFRGYIGSRMEMDATGRTGMKGVPAEGERIAEDWDVPDFADVWEDGTKYEAARDMLRVAEEEGVQVEGSILEAVRVMNAYYLEIANIAIYRCFGDKTFDHYLDVQEENLDARLPSLDLGTLDPKHLELVKTELPDEGWFALSLKNRDDLEG